MKNIWSKVIIGMFSIIAMTTAMTGCNDKVKGDTNDSPNAQTSFQIGDEIAVTPIVANKSFDEMTDDEIDSISRNVFEQASIVFENLYFSTDLIELDEAVSIVQDDTTWYKVKYIDTWEDFQKICLSVYGKAFYEETILQAAEKYLMEYEGVLYQSPERIGGIGGYCRLIPNSQKIIAITKEAKKIVISANMQGVKQSSTQNESEDGILNYTIVVEGGNYVLENFYGIKENE